MATREPSSIATEPTPDARGLADTLHRLQESANGMPIPVARILDTLGGQTLSVAILLLAAPFVVLPVPGVSTVIGFIIIGLSIGVLANHGRKAARRDLQANRLRKDTRSDGTRSRPNAENLRSSF